MRGNLSDDVWTILIALLCLAFVADKFGPRLVRARHAAGKDLRPQKRNGPRLTVRALRWHAYRRKALLTILVAAGMSALVLLSAHHGGITYAAAFGSIAVFFAMAGLLLVPVLRVYRRPLHRALARCGSDLSALDGQRMQKIGAQRFYMDDNWLICVGGGSSVLLHAESIDFSRPVQQRQYRWLLPGGNRTNSVDICETVFHDHAGAEYPALLQPEDAFIRWIHRHGGRFDSEKPRRKYDRKEKNR